LKGRGDSGCHPPPLPSGGLPVCTGPDFKKRKKKNPTKKASSYKDCEENNYYVTSYIAPMGFSHGKTKSQG
jgi:hypothetical protein